MQVVETTHDTVQDERQSECLNIALVGGGSGCKALIQFLEAHMIQHFQFNVVCLLSYTADKHGILFDNC